MTALMFAATAFFWGSSAVVTTTQAVVLPASLSVAYRMLVVFVVMLAVAAALRRPIGVARGDRAMVAAQGVLFFGLSFVAFYEATRLVESGVAAVVLSGSAIVAALLARVFLKTPLSAAALAGLGLGVAGLATIFSPQIAALATGDAGAPAGLAYAALAAIAAAGGTVIGARNQKRGVPALATMVWGALAGAAFCLAWTFAPLLGPLASGGDLVSALPPLWDPAPAYLAGLAYLAIAASCVTFLMYFALVARLGPGRAAYTLATIPLVALAFSVALEGLALGPSLLVGAGAILLGNVLVLGEGMKLPAWRLERRLARRLAAHSAS